MSSYPIGGYAPGNYQKECKICNGTFLGDKYAIQCEPCAVRFVVAYNKEVSKPPVTRIVIHTQEITDCSECPHRDMQPDYSADSFSREEKCMCNKLNRIVHRYVGTFDKMPVPEECPLINKE